jgi:hypothetical protein
VQLQTIFISALDGSGFSSPSSCCVEERGPDIQWEEVDPSACPDVITKKKT